MGAPHMRRTSSVPVEKTQRHCSWWCRLGANCRSLTLSVPHSRHWLSSEQTGPVVQVAQGSDAMRRTVFQWAPGQCHHIALACSKRQLPLTFRRCHCHRLQAFRHQHTSPARDSGKCLTLLAISGESMTPWACTKSRRRLGFSRLIITALDEIGRPSSAPAGRRSRPALA